MTTGVEWGMDTSRRGFLGALIAAPIVARILPFLPQAAPAKLYPFISAPLSPQFVADAQNFAAAEYAAVFNRALKGYGRTDQFAPRLAEWNRYGR